MHDLATIQRLNREETEKAMSNAVGRPLSTIEQKLVDEAIQRHPAGKGLARCATCGDIIPTADDNMAEHIGEYHTVRTPEQVAQDTLDAHSILPHWRRNGEQIAALIVEAIENDRATRANQEA